MKTHFTRLNSFLTAIFFISGAFSPALNKIGLKSPELTISGHIQNEFGTPSMGVTVILSGDVEAVTETDADGNYAFPNIPDGSSVIITPISGFQNCPDDCIDVLDRIRIRSHILAITFLDSPYGLIAGDLNNSSGLSTFDEVLLHNLITTMMPDLTNNTCHRYVDAEYVFPDPGNPWAESWPETIIITEGSGNITADFIDIQIGNLNDCPTAFSDPFVTFTVGSGQIACIGDQVCVPVTAENFFDIIGLQFSLNYDPSVLTFSHLNNLNLPGLTTSSFGIPPTLTEGYITTSWIDATLGGFTLPVGSSLFEVCFDIIGDPGGSTLIAISDTPTIREIVNFNNQVSIPFVVDGTVTVNEPVCPDNIEIMAFSGECGAIATWIIPDSIDLCGNAWVLTSDYQSGDFFPGGETQVTYTGINQNGDSFNCSFTITVLTEDFYTIADCQNIQDTILIVPPDICEIALPDFRDSISIDSCLTALQWKDIGAGHRFSVGIQQDGTLWSWGDNEFGQLGDGTFTDQNFPKQVGMDNNWAEVSCGLNFTVALKTDGTLWSWGVNNFGQLGYGNLTDSNSPVQIGIGNQWESVKTGQNHCIALQNNGTLWAWGENMAGQLGLGDFLSRTAPQQIGMDTDWTKVAGGESASLALKSTGTLWGAGSNYANLMQAGIGVTVQNTFNQVGSASDWVEFDLGQHFLGINTIGELWAWGNNSYEQVGNGSTQNQETPVQIGTDTDWQKVYAKSDGSFAIKNNKLLFAWGQNIAGELGIGSSGNNQSTPLQVNNELWEMAEFGYEQSFGIQADNSLWACGPNTQGELGLGSANLSLVTSFTLLTPGLTYQLFQNPPPGTSLPPGLHSVFFTLIDANGNQNTCSFVLEVRDDEPPFLICKDAFAISLPANGELFLEPAILFEFIAENCGVVDQFVFPFEFDCSNVGQTIPVSVGAVDASGNFSSCWSDVTIVDQISPQIICPPDSTVTTLCGDMEAFVDFVIPLAIDNCSASVTCNQTPGMFPIGVTPVTCTAIDIAGNQTQCTFLITVLDGMDEPLAIQCPSELSISLNENCEGEVPDLIAFANITGGCPPYNLTQTPLAGITFASGTSIPAQITVTDQSGQSESCTFDLVVDQNMLPVFVTLPDPIADIECHDPFPDFQELEVTDDCSIPAVTFQSTISPNFTDYCSFYTVTYTWTAFDWFLADFTTVSQSFQILPDLLAPVFDQLPASIPDISCDEALPAQETLTATDNCSNAIVIATIDPYTPDLLNPYTINYRWSAVDDCGNSTEVTQSFQVLPNNTPPEILCPADLIISVGDLCLANYTPDPVVNNNPCAQELNVECTGAESPLSPGIYTIICTATNEFGSNSCSYTLTVIDDIPPTPVCFTSLVIDIGPTGSLILPPDLFDAGSYDNCSIQSFGLDVTVLDCNQVGQTIPVIMSVTDSNGNTDFCNASVIVIDNINPQITCPDDIVLSAPIGDTGIDVFFTDPVVSDNCGATWSCDFISGDFFPCGITTVTCNVIDPSGNTANCTFNVTVICESSDLANFVLSDEFTQVGDLVCVELSVNHFVDILTFQYTIEYDPGLLTFVNTANYNLQWLDGADFNGGNAGFISTAWSDSDVSAETLPDGTVICEICFIGDAVGLSSLVFSSSQTPKEVVNGSLQIINATYKDGSVLVIEPTGECNSLLIEAINLQEETSNCCWQLNYNNNFPEGLAGIRITALDDVDLLYEPEDIHPTLFDIVNSPGSVTLVSSIMPGDPIPQGQLLDFFRFCLTGMASQPQQVHIEWLDLNFQTICDTIIQTDCAPEPDDCLYITKDSIYCKGDLINFAVTFKNPLSSDFTVGKIVIDVTDPDLATTVTQVIFPVPAIQPGDTYDYVFVINDTSLGGKDLCFNIVAHDALEPLNCCSPGSTYCVRLPKCEPCQYVDISYDLQDSTAVDSCCYTLSISNDFQTDFFESIVVEILNPGVVFDNVVYDLSTGWINTHNADYSELTWTHSSGFVPVYSGELMDFCLGNVTTTAPVNVGIHWMQGDSILCTDTLQLVCHDCLIIDPATEVNCDENKNYVFTLNFQNISDFPVNKIRIVEDAPNDFISNDVIDLGNIYNPGEHIGPIDIPIDGAAGPGDYCFIIALKLEIVDSLSIDCCNIEHCEWLPDCDSLCCFYPLDFQLTLDEGFEFEVSCEEETVTAFPNGTNFCDKVDWTFRKIGQNITIGGVTFGEAEVVFTLPELGTYELCMNIVRQGPDGEECYPGEGEIQCQLVYVSCEELCVDPSIIDPDFNCPFLGFPVCGCDGVTYQNACYAEHYYGVTEWTPGFCDVFDFQVPTDSHTPMILANPVKDILRATWKGKRITAIQIYNLQGQFFDHLAFDNDNEFTTEIEVATLPQGLYLLQVRDDNGDIRTEKFVKM